MVARATIAHCRGIGDEVVEMTRQELDIADLDAVSTTMRSERPDAVINCAAFTDVDGAESNPDISRAANDVGVRNLAEATKDVGARFVTISTDYVFDGSNAGFYTEDDQPNPSGVYGITKYDGEISAASANADSVIVRSGWIYGPDGTNFLSVMHRLLAEGKKIKAINDSYGTPTFAGDLAKRLRELAGTTANGIFHVTNSGDGTTYFGFAEKVCELGGFDKTLVEPVSHTSLQRPAPRPVSSKLGSVRIEKLGLAPLQNWESALEEFLREEGGR